MVDMVKKIKGGMKVKEMVGVDVIVEVEGG